MEAKMNKSTLYRLFTWVIACIATISSLIFSEYLGFIPCELCWYQRILMYPLVIIYGVAILKKDAQIAFPGLILSGIGMFVSAYHYALQKLPALQGAGGFCGDIPCNLQYVNYLGFITIPFLAGVAFIVIFSLHLVILRAKK